MGILILLLVLSISLAISLYRLIAVTSIKISAFALDFALIFFATIYLAHQYLQPSFSSSVATYAIYILMGLTTLFAYGVLILMLHRKFPRMSKAMNFFIVLVGISVAFPLALDFGSAVLKAVGIIKNTVTMLPIFESNSANMFVHYLMIFLISIPTFNARMRYMDHHNTEPIN